MSIIKLCFIAITVALFSPASLLAADALLPLNFIGRYDFNWSGVEIGQLTLAIDESGGGYKMHLVVASGGVVNLFTRHMSDTVINGRHSSGSYAPQYYESYYKTKQKPRHVRLVFDAKGAVTEELNEPPEDRSDRLEVPHKLKDGAYDPLTLLMALRSGATEARGFDAKRLYAVHVREDSKERLSILGKWRPSVSLILSRTPLGGMTEKEMKEYHKGEPPLTLYLSDDKNRIPLAVSVPIMFGEVTGVLVKECAVWKDCAVEVNVK